MINLCLLKVYFFLASTQAEQINPKPKYSFNEMLLEDHFTPFVS